jgi:hypothetical protein
VLFSGNKATNIRPDDIVPRQKESSSAVKSVSVAVSHGKNHIPLWFKEATKPRAISVSLLAYFRTRVRRRAIPRDVAPNCAHAENGLHRHLNALADRSQERPNLAEAPIHGLDVGCSVWGFIRRLAQISADSFSVTNLRSSASICGSSMPWDLR